MSHLKARSLDDADCLRIIPAPHRGEGEIVPLLKKEPGNPSTYTFDYQQDKYVVTTTSPITFARLPYPCSSNPSLGSFLSPPALTTAQTTSLESLYGKNEYNIPIPSFSSLFG